jgi:hypothetical protein
MIRLLIFLSCYASVWANMPGVGKVLQPAFLGLFLVGAIYAIARRQILLTAPSIAEVVLYGAGILSAAVTVWRSMDDYVLISMLFIAALILMSIIARATTLEDLLDAVAYTYLLATLTCVIVDRHALLKALSISMGHNGLYRFGPLHTHPDLTGLIYGSGAILMARRALLARKLAERLAMLAGIGLACTFILAASARASLLALAVAALGALVLEVRPRRATYLKMAGAGAAALVVVTAVSAHRVLGWLQGMLEYRGAATGGSGRTKIWEYGFSQIFADPTRLLLGGGIRTSEGLNGYVTTENSYISIMLDSGLFMGSAIIGVYLFCAFKALRLSRSAPRTHNPNVCLFAYFAFVLIESFFNRYLLALGNVGSLVALMIVISLSIREVRAPRRSTLTEYPRAAGPRATSLEPR